MAAITLYDISVISYLRQLDSLEGFLRKGEAWAKENGKSESDVFSVRLAPDMEALAFQVRRVSDTMRFTAVRVAEGVAHVPMDDEEKTFADLYERIDKTRHFLRGVPREAFDAVKPDKEIVWMAAGAERKATALGYITAFSTPNMFFHLTIAYALLRHIGVPVGKQDYMGAAPKPPK